MKKNMPTESKDKQSKGVPTKVLSYFPLIPKFKRWFQSDQTTNDLTWHTKEREVDVQLCHPVD